MFCRMDSSRMETGAEQPIKRGRRRPRKAVREDQTSGASSSDPLVGDVELKTVQEPQVQSTVLGLGNPFLTQG